MNQNDNNGANNDHTFLREYISVKQLARNRAIDGYDHLLLLSDRQSKTSSSKI